MDTVKLPRTARAAVLIDMDWYFGTSPALTRVERYARVERMMVRAPHAQFVALYSSPTEDADDSFQMDLKLPDFDVVIRNTGDKPVEEFHKNALDVVKEFSNLISVVGYTENHSISDVWLANGVLVVING